MVMDNKNNSSNSLVFGCWPQAKNNNSDLLFCQLDQSNGGKTWSALVGRCADTSLISFATLCSRHLHQVTIGSFVAAFLAPASFAQSKEKEKCDIFSSTIFLFSFFLGENDHKKYFIASRPFKFEMAFVRSSTVKTVGNDEDPDSRLVLWIEWGQVAPGS